MLRAALIAVAIVAFGTGAAQATSTVPTAPSEGSVGIRLLDAPADRADDPRAQIYIIDHLPLGATIQRRIEITNTTPVEQTVQLYAAGAGVTEEGWTVFDGREPNELSQMVTVDPTSVVVPSNGAQQATVTITVPGDAEQREHYAVVWAELAAAQGDITIVNRVGIRLYVSIGSGNEPPSDFTVDHLTAIRDPDGTPVVHATVTNTGGRALDLTGELTLAEGPGGLSAGPFATTGASTVATGQSGLVRVQLDLALPAGPWQAVMVVRSGLLERTVEGEITFPDAPAETAPPVAVTEAAVEVQQGRGGLGRTALLIIGGCLILGVAIPLVFVILWRRRKRDEEDDEGAATPADQPARV